MAIIKDMPGVIVRILVNNVVLKEYDDDEDVEENSVNKYIEATSGAFFTIQWRFDKRFKYKTDGIALKVYIDGQYTDSAVIDLPKLLTKQGYTSYLSGRRRKVGNDYIEENFTFSGLVIGN